MTNKETKEVKTYEDLSIEDRFQRVNALWLQIEDVIKGKGNSGCVESFFIALHELGSECDRFLRHYFNDSAHKVITNVDILNKVNKINLMIRIK